MTRRREGLAVIALIGMVSLSASAVAQGTGEDGARPTVRAGEPVGSAGVTPGAGAGNRGGVGAPGGIETRSGAAGPPSLGDVNRGMSGFYRNRIGMTPPSGRFGGGGPGGGGPGGGGRR
jgi:translation initiation factor IF-2